MLNPNIMVEPFPSKSKEKRGPLALTLFSVFEHTTSHPSLVSMSSLASTHPATLSLFSLSCPLVSLLKFLLSRISLFSLCTLPPVAGEHFSLTFSLLCMVSCALHAFSPHLTVSIVNHCDWSFVFCVGCMTTAFLPSSAASAFINFPCHSFSLAHTHSNDHCSLVYLLEWRRLFLKAAFLLQSELLYAPRPR